MSEQPPLAVPGRVLVAARGATCLRVARAVRAMGGEPVGVHTAADRDAGWLGCLTDVEEVPAYDDVPGLVEAACRLGATVVHPGVGFASESPHLARRCQERGLRWAGPDSEVLAALTDKLALARAAADLGIPVPRTVGPVRTPTQLRQALAQVAGHGGGAVVKTVRGGGGRGVSVLSGTQAAGPSQALLEQVLGAASGLGDLLVQEAVPRARHIEVQAAADSRSVLTLSTRECSVQRRSQKLLEEAPAPLLHADHGEQMERWTRLLLESVGYRGVGTCEFLLPEHGGPVLLEVNARLQVEHAVTEEVTGTDLVVLQLALALGHDLAHALPLARAHAAYPPAAHAVEVRLYAEDPATLLPQAGLVTRLALPVSLPAQRQAVVNDADAAPAGATAPAQVAGAAGAARVAEGSRPARPDTARPGEPHSPDAARAAGSVPRLRTERGVFPGDRVSGSYSEPLALLTVAADDRSQALTGLRQALTEVQADGVPTLAPLLTTVLAHPGLSEDGYAVTTAWLEETVLPSPQPEPAAAAVRPDPAPTAPGGEAVREIEVRAPMPGVLVVPPRTGTVSAAAPVAVLEAMKMRLPVPAPADGTLRPAPSLEAGTAVHAGQVIAHLDVSLPHGAAAGVPGPARGRQAGQERAPEHVPQRRPEQPPPRRRPQPGTAHRRVRDLLDPGSGHHLVDDDAVVTAWGRLAGREVAVWAQDPAVVGGTIGLSGARRVAALINEAAARTVPVISLVDGGGARVQEGADALAGVGLILAAQCAAHGRCLQIGLVLGPAAGGAAYSPALTDVMIMVEGSGQVFLTGPAVLAASTGEQVQAEQLGGAAVHAYAAGTAHLTVPDDAAAWDAARRIVVYAPLPLHAPPSAAGTAGTRDDGTRPARGLLLLPGGLGPQVRPSDRASSSVVPTDLREAYDVRHLLRRLTDRSELDELRPGWAPHLVTALGRVDGVSLGIVANQPSQMAGVLDARSAQKAAEHLELCARLGLPLLSVVDTPGFLPGAQAEADGTVRLGARLVEAYARYHDAGLPLLTLVTRQAFGGAYVALGSAALAGAATACWPQAQIGVMDPATAASLTGRRRLREAAEQGQDPQALRARLTAAERERQQAPVVQAQGWVEEIITPEHTRAWVSRHLASALSGLPVTTAGRARSGPGTERPAGRLTVRPLAGPTHPGDGWVYCTCGRRHWGRNGAAGLLVWRRATGQDGLEVLLALRAPWTHHGGTWGLPGGAVADSEDPAQAALRELEEETGMPAGVLRLGPAHVQEHGAWRYTTFTAQAPAGHDWDRLLPCDGESTALTWFRLRHDGARWLAPAAATGARPTAPLLPALAAVWEQVASLLPPPGTVR